MRPCARLAVGLAILLPLALEGRTQDRRPRDLKPATSRVSGEFLVLFRSEATEPQRTAAIAGADVRRKVKLGKEDVRLIKLRGPADEDAALRTLQKNPAVAHAEPNYLYRKTQTLPNDPSFGQLWGLHNTGQSGGTADADIDAPEAWDLTTGSSSVVVAVLDTGVDLTHPDLAANIWVNPNDPPGGGDQDGNGKVDDVNGWDFFDNDNTPTDSEGHGTHVAGTIGARGNNGIGVSGVAWNVKIMALRFLGPSGGSTADAIEAIDYATDLKVNHGINLVAINNSWGGGGFSALLQTAMQNAGNAGILNICAAGNEGSNNEIIPSYPSNYALDSIIAVAASDHTEQMASFSCFGTTSVDLFAPGDSIYSTVPTSADPSGYDTYSGTSMATPHVTGAVALIYSYLPSSTLSQARSRILYNVDRRDGYEGRVRTCGRLNVFKALQDTDSTAPFASTIAASDPSYSAVEISWIAPGDDGGSGTAAAYELRYATSAITNDTQFNAATLVPCVPAPQVAGTPQSVRVCGLSSGTTYHFAMKAIDNLGNTSLLSNSPSATTQSVALATTTFSDTFTGNGSTVDPAKWTVDSPWARENVGGNKHAADSLNGNYANDVDAAITTISLNLSGKRDATLSFNHQYNIEAGYDFGYVEASGDGGGSWDWITQFSGVQGDLAVTRLCLHDYDNLPNVKVRFRLWTDFTVVRDGWLVDNVSILCQIDNEAPTADAQAVTTNEDAATGITLTGSDPDSDPLTYAVVTSPTKGILAGTAPNLTYTPNANQNGADSFTFKVNDGTVDSAAATVSITITPINDAPVASNQSPSTPEDTPLGITLGASDVDGNPLTYAIVSGPTNGGLNGSGASRTYTPNANYNGPDSFTFKVNDGTVDSNVATVSITVTAANDAPVANAQSVSTTEDTPLGITLTGSDVEGSALTYSIVSPPSNGTLIGAGASHTYTPNANFNGPDSFTFRVNDGSVNSPTATVSITVNAVNDAPVANAQSPSTPEDTAVGITLTGTDVEGSGLTFTVLTNPSNGNLSGTAPTLTYTPNPNYSGPDSFTFKVNDGAVDSPTATVSITVTAVNDLPVANGQSVATPEDAALPITLTGSDVEGSPLTYTVVGNPTHGGLTGTAPNLTYTPALNYTGPDSFTFKVNDGTADSPTATISITVGSSNDPPVATAQSVTATEDTLKPITLAGTDPDSDPITGYTVLSGPSNGLLSGVAPNLSYTPNANYTGPDSFTFRVTDGTLDSAPATVSITVTAVNDPPVADAQAVSTAEDTGVLITLTGSDIDGGAPSYIVVTGPANGVLTGSGASRTYTPTANTNGPDSFTFKINDGTADGNTATVSITVTPVNDPPSATAQSVNVPEDSFVAITLAGTDLDGNPITGYTVLSNPSNGVLSGTAPNVTYTPNANYNGPDGFTFKVTDGSLDSAAATVTITVQPANDPPVADAQSLGVTEDTPLGITLTGSDIDGNPLTFTVVGLPTKGTISGGTGAARTYTPNANATGADSFTFRVNDGTVNSPLATVSLTISSVNDAPSATPQSVATPEETGLAITLAGTDPDGDPVNFTVATNPAHGALTGTAPNLTYTPNLDYSGPDSFTFTVNDGVLTSAAATVSINVTPVNDAPTALPQAVTTPENVPKAITLTGTDPDGNPLTYTLVAGPSNGALSGAPPSVTYTPTADYDGPDSFTFKVNDGTVDSAAATVSITVSADATPPVITPVSPAGPTASTTSSPYLMTGTASDTVGLDRVEWSNALNGQSGTAASAANWSISVPLQTGVNPVTITAFDLAGNSSSVVISVTKRARAGGGGGGGGGCGLTGLESVLLLGLLGFLRRR